MTEHDWKRFSEALREWQTHPVTETLQRAMRAVLLRRRQQLTSDFLAGRPVSEADRKALLLVEQWAEDFFEASADDVRAAMESEDDKQLGHQPARV
jgi:hypothetical protein